MTTHDSTAPRLLDQVRDRIRRKHYSVRTEQAYLHWVKAFVRFHAMKHPAGMGASEIESFLTYLAVERHVSSSTQNQALSGLLFLYREVLEIELPWLDGIERSKRPKRLPVVLTQEEVIAVLSQLDGTTALILKLAYGTGMRIMEVVRLRVKDVEFARAEILIREGKGCRDRVTMLPKSLMLPLRDHLARVKSLHERDCKEGLGEVFLPFALARKYPGAARDWGWQYVFPSNKLSNDPRSGRKGRPFRCVRHLQSPTWFGGAYYRLRKR